MSKKHLLALFPCSLVPWTIGNGIAPLLPMQAADLDASQATAGYCLSLSHVVMAAGRVTAGWLSDRFGRRKMAPIVAGLMNIPALYLMGRATTLWGLAVALAAWFFCTGLIIALLSIAAAVCAEGSKRRKVFGLLAGWLSDRLGRKRFLAFSFLATTTGLLVLYVSTSLWHFWVASMLFTPSFISGPVGSALVTDLVPQESLVRALAVYSATTWLGGIAGCAITGCATQCFGMSPILLAGTCLARWLSACWLLRGDPGGLEWNQYPCREGCCRK